MLVQQGVADEMLHPCARSAARMRMYVPRRSSALGGRASVCKHLAMFQNQVMVMQSVHGIGL